MARTRGEREVASRGLPGGQPEHHGQDDTRPGGSEGDNLVKTRLSTGDMAEVFVYNNGSLAAGNQAGAESDAVGRPAVGGADR